MLRASSKTRLNKVELEDIPNTGCQPVSVNTTPLRLVYGIVDSFWMTCM